MPAEKGADDAEIGHGIDQERSSYSNRARKRTTERRSDGAAMLMPTLSAETAGARSSLGTSCGTMDCQREQSPPRLRRRGTKRATPCRRDEVEPDQRSEARCEGLVHSSPAMRNLRRFTISASAPAGSARRTIGKLTAAWTSDTTTGEGSRFVINHPEAALYIHQRRSR